MNPPDPSSLDPAKLKRARERRRLAVKEAISAGKTWGRTPRERLRNAIERLEHEMLLIDGLDPELRSRLHRSFRIARAKRDAALPVLKHESRAYTFRRKRAQLELEVWR